MALPMSDFEVQRMKRIAENQKRLGACAPLPRHEHSERGKGHASMPCTSVLRTCTLYPCPTAEELGIPNQKKVMDNYFQQTKNVRAPSAFGKKVSAAWSLRLDTSGHAAPR
jgi:hypothetical protein